MPDQAAPPPARLRLVCVPSFEEVYAEHHDFVWRCLRGLGVPAHAVDDATQDVFIVVHRKLPGFDHAAPVKAWIFGVARNVARKYAAKSVRVPSPLQLVQPTGPDELLQRREAAAMVEQFLESLDEDKRAVFVLAQLEGMTAPEIAEVLKIKLNTAYSRLRAARQRFDRALCRYRARGGNDG